MVYSIQAQASIDENDTDFLGAKLVFSSTIFLFAFLPIFLAFYFLIPSRAAKNVVLLLFSLLFYAWGEPIYVFLMIGSIVVNWAIALGIDKAKKGGKFFLLLVGLVLNLSVLGLFKYETFISSNINRAIGEEFLTDLQLALPIGISFFTLQAISYVIDVYRGKVKPQRNILYLGMYIAMFPQLIAGPIVRYSQIEREIKNRTVSIAKFAQGIRLFIVGLGKKVLLANTAAILANSLLTQDAQTIGWVGCFSGILAYTFQIYFDFSGYSDMAIGMGKMMGFNYPRNFNYPYISRSVTEFWRRWHMSLGSFFRDYVYIPLGGSHVNIPRWMFNIMIVWGLTGIWHGAAWNFLLWGLYYGVLLMCEKLFLLNALNKLPRVFGHLWCFLTFFFGWLLFSVSGLHNVIEWTLGVFGVYGFTGTSTLWELQSWSYISLLPVFIIGSTPIFPWIRKHLEAWASGKSPAGIVAAPEKGNDLVPPGEIKIRNVKNANEAHCGRLRICKILNVLCDIALFVIFALSCMSIVSGGYNPFIYFQF